MKSLLLFFSCFIFSQVFCQTIKGKVVDKVRDENIQYATIMLLDSSNKIVATEYTNVEGRFKFKKIPPGVYSVKIQQFTRPDTIFKNIKNKYDVRINFDIHRFCKYDESRNNKTCPICKNEDQVIPIRYGLLVSLDGNPMDGEGEWFKSGGCKVTDCDPNWYCKRDHFEF